MWTSERQTSSARAFARRLLLPGVLDEGLRSGVFFFSGPDADMCAWVDTYLANALTGQGATVVQLNLNGANLSRPVHSVRRALYDAVDKPHHPPVYGDVTNTALTSGYQPTLTSTPRFNKRLGLSEDSSFGEIIQTLVKLHEADVVLIVDGIDVFSQTGDGRFLLCELKAARDAINLAFNSNRYFFFLGVGSSETMMRRLTMDSGQAFFGANCIHISSMLPGST